MRRIMHHGLTAVSCQLDDHRRPSRRRRGHRLGDAMRKAEPRRRHFFGDGTLGSGDLHETMHIAGVWGLPLILVCETTVGKWLRPGTKCASTAR